MTMRCGKLVIQCWQHLYPSAPLLATGNWLKPFFDRGDSRIVDILQSCYGTRMKKATVMTPAPGAQAEGFTTREFMQIVESGAFDGYKAELVRGAIQKMAPAGFEHSTRNFSIAQSLASAYEGQQVWIAVDLAVEVDDKTSLGADIAIVRADAPRSGAVPGSCLKLVVEISDSTLSRDLGFKISDYARAEVATYWVVDVRARVVHVMSDAVGDKYQSCSVARFGEPLFPPGTDTPISID